MEVILNKDVEKLGNKLDIVKVKPGFGTNYLIPKGLAMIASASNRKMRDETIKQRSFTENRIKDEAVALASALKKAKITIGAKVSTKGKIFGSVSNIQLADALKNAKFNIDKTQIKVDKEAIKELGVYSANLRLHKDVEMEIKFEVVAE